MRVYYGKEGYRPDPARCCAAVRDGFHSFQCKNKIKIKRDYEGRVRGFCKVHDPVRLEAQRTERNAEDQRARDAGMKIQIERDRRDKAYDHYRDALLAIARGNGDSRERAEAVLKMNGDWQ